MPSTLAATRLAIVELLGSVPDVGIVHRCERYAGDDSAYKRLYLYRPSAASDAFGEEAHIRGWHVRRTATKEVNSNGRILNEHTWTIRGYMSFKDGIESELIFDELVENMRDAFRFARLGVPAVIGNGVFEERGVQVVSTGPVFFAGALCHSAALEFASRNWFEWRKA
ncbi:hypothetical protein G7047_19260 [Diaphorobacter sp. HDW4A]|nr:hypothetical protein G7047_19260 [Diaphorobacter sp. HDW4A]